MSDTPAIGTILKDNQPRDAVHFAIACVVAATPLQPGQRIGFVGVGQHALVSGAAQVIIGIVDPFLPEEVNPGERFYMFLLPNTVVGMRHEWQHPAFEGDFDYQGRDNPQQIARDWLALWALRKGIPYSDLLAEASTGGYICARGTDMHGWEDGEEELTLFWQHLETVTGMAFNTNHRNRVTFTCSC